MKNTLKKYEEDEEQQFFVMKCYMYMIHMEDERKKAEYHLFFIKKNSNPDAYHKGYVNLKHKPLNRMEVAYFKDTMDKNYDNVLENEHGTIYNLKGRPFDKSKCPTYKQMVLNLES